MTVEELHDEISAIDAIYPNSTMEVASQLYNLKVPEHEDLQIQMSFPSTYPDEMPNVIQVINNNTRIYTDTNYLESHVKESLRKVFHEGEVCVFELFTELEAVLEKYIEDGNDQEQKEDGNSGNSFCNLSKVLEEKVTDHTERTKIKNHPHSNAKSIVIDPLKGWIQSEPIVDRGSTFIGYTREVHSVEEAADYLDLLITDKKIAKSAHNISSWRIKKENGIQFQDCDDDGETAAGGRLLHLLTVRICILFDLLNSEIGRSTESNIIEYLTNHF